MSVTFHGVSSDSLGLIVEQCPSYNIPSRKMSAFEVAGRNGDILYQQYAWQNVIQSYECYIRGGADLATSIQAVIAWLTQDGYQRLTDSYDTTHYRLAYCNNAAEVVNALNLMGRCTLEFSCKPQRFLLSGETEETVTNTEETYTGNFVSFDNDNNVVLKTLEADINPVQDTSGGNPSPDNICPITGWTGANVTRTGKNMLDLSTLTALKTENGITFTVNSDYSVTANGTATSQCQIFWRIPRDVARNFGGAIFSVCDSLPSGTASFLELAVTPYTSYATTNGVQIDSSISEISGDCNFIIRITSGTTLSNYKFYPMIYNGNDNTYEAYNGTIYPVTWSSEAGTVYGGYVDVVSRTLTKTHQGVDLGTLSWGQTGTATGVNWRFYASLADSVSTSDTSTNPTSICSIAPLIAAGQTYNCVNGFTIAVSNIYIYLDSYSTLSESDFTTAVTGQTLVYPLATPVEYQLTEQEVELLIGTNNILVDTGDTTAVVDIGDTITNSTAYNACPLLYVNTAQDGSINIDGTVIQCSAGEYYIDCDSQNAYFGNVNMNSYISASEFPMLSANSTCNITLDNIDECKVTPRWWVL